MTQNSVPVASYLLIKRGLYYGPNNQGYTGVKDRAGRYFESDARPDYGVTAVHETDAPLFAPACWQETKVELLAARITELEAHMTAEPDRMLAVLERCAKVAEDIPYERYDDCDLQKCRIAAAIRAIAAQGGE